MPPLSHISPTQPITPIQTTALPSFLLKSLFLVYPPLPLFHFIESTSVSCLLLNSIHPPMTGVGGAHSHWSFLSSRKRPKIQVQLLKTGKTNVFLTCHLEHLPPPLCLSLWTPTPRTSACMGSAPSYQPDSGGEKIKGEDSRPRDN